MGALGMLIIGAGIVALSVLGLWFLDRTSKWLIAVSSVNPWITRHERWREYVRIVAAVVLSVWLVIGLAWIAIGVAG